MIQSRQQDPRRQDPTHRCICATGPNWSRNTEMVIQMHRTAPLTQPCMTNPKLTGTATAFYPRRCTCASSLRTSATCAATCRHPATTYTANAPKASKRGTVSALHVRRIFARPFTKSWRPFGGFALNMNETDPDEVPSGFIGRAVTNRVNRTARIPGGRSDTRSGLSVRGLRKNQSTRTIRILTRKT